MDESVERLKELVSRCDNIVFFGGAGVSTESGIPDFRNVDGLYSQKYDYPPEGREDAVATILRNENFGRIAWRNNKAGGDKITARFYLFG